MESAKLIGAILLSRTNISQLVRCTQYISDKHLTRRALNITLGRHKAALSQPA